MYLFEKEKHQSFYYCLLGLTDLFQANLNEYKTLKEDYYQKLESED